MSLHLRRTCRLFWCYQCQRSVRIISSPAFQVSFCPRCYGQFLHELHVTPAFPLPFHSPPPPPLVVPTQPRLTDLEPERRPISVPTPVHPGDYFAGPGLAELIDQLTQNDRPGPQPASASAINAMPVVRVGEGHLREGPECPVCKEEFEVGEEAREMPCKHVYHSDCIVPWLQSHNSCPVCRFQLPTTNSSGGTAGSNGNARNVGGHSRRGVVASSGGNGGSVRPARWNPIPSLWPFRGSSARWENNYHPRQDEEDPLENLGGY